MIMNKKQLLERVNELEKREILLEYVVDKFHELILIFENHPASKMIVAEQAFDIAGELYDHAQVREGIETLVNVEIEYEDSEYSEESDNMHYGPSTLSHDQEEE